MEKARIVQETNAKGVTFDRLIRGKLHDKDKHWGMRSNLNFRRTLEKGLKKREDQAVPPNS